MKLIVAAFLMCHAGSVIGIVISTTIIVSLATSWRVNGSGLIVDNEGDKSRRTWGSQGGGANCLFPPHKLCLIPMFEIVASTMVVASPLAAPRSYVFVLLRGAAAVADEAIEMNVLLSLIGVLWSLVLAQINTAVDLAWSRFFVVDIWSNTFWFFKMRLRGRCDCCGGDGFILGASMVVVDEVMVVEEEAVVWILCKTGYMRCIEVANGDLHHWDVRMILCLVYDIEFLFVFETSSYFVVWYTYLKLKSFCNSFLFI